MAVKTKAYTVLKRFRQPGEGWKEEGDTVELAEVEARYLKLDGKVEVKNDTSTKTSKKAEAKSE